MEVPAADGDRLGVVIGNSLTASDLFDGADARRVDTAWGPVDTLTVGATTVVRRHGVGTYTPAHRLDHRATVTALVDAGCDRVLAFASTGSLGTHPVGTVIAPDDFVAFAAYASFHDDEAGHTVPGFDLAWRARVVATWARATGAPLVDGGVYVQTSGPRFETPAEVRVLAGWGDVVGMTLAEECILAREAGLAYAAVCTVDNLANGLDAERLTVDAFHAGVAANQDSLVTALRAFLPALAATPRPTC